MIHAVRRDYSFLSKDLRPFDGHPLLYPLVAEVSDALGLTFHLVGGAEVPAVEGRVLVEALGDLLLADTGVHGGCNEGGEVFPLQGLKVDGACGDGLFHSFSVA